jgi:hypothetical protein
MAEAEYYSASAAGVDVLCLHNLNLFKRMGFAQEDPTPVYKDNTACIE